MLRRGGRRFHDDDSGASEPALAQVAQCFVGAFEQGGEKMKILVIYYSRTGVTRKAGERLAAVLR